MLSQSKFEEFRLSKTLTKRLTEEIGKSAVEDKNPNASWLIVET